MIIKIDLKEIKLAHFDLINIVLNTPQPNRIIIGTSDTLPKVERIPIDSGNLTIVPFEANNRHRPPELTCISVNRRREDVSACVARPSEQELSARAQSRLDERRIVCVECFVTA